MMHELEILAAVTERERVFAGMVECERIEADRLKAQRDLVTALLRQIFSIITSDDVTVNCRTNSAALKLADWVGQSSTFVEDQFKCKKTFAARVAAEVAHG